MNAKPRPDFQPCVPGAFRGGLSRTEFFDGMVLSEADMKREQAYWQTKRRLTNRALGQGVVWGLAVEWDAKARSFTICPGYGLSCCGDDLIVECPETVCEGDLVDVCSEEFRHLLLSRNDPCDCDLPDGPVEACLLLEYVECPEEARRVFEDPCAEKPRGCRYGAVRETVRLRLVPPPKPVPGPIEQFCARIALIRASLAANGIFVPDPVLAHAPARLVASIAAFHAADGTPAGGATERLGVSQDDFTELALATNDVGHFRIGIEPPPGHVFARASRDGVEQGVGETLMGVFAELPPDATTAVVFDVELAPLFGAGPGRRLTCRASPTRADDTMTVRMVVEAVEDVPRRDCFTLIADGLSDAGDLRCTARTLALALLCGWFRSLLGSGPCDDPKAAEARPALAAMAWVVAWIAWRVIFGIDMTREGAASVEKCLRQLFAEWCRGFAYKGPRCACDAHGTILGTVRVTPKGRILCFDAWAHRRYVLTGPLVTHWGSQLGLVPIDVMATRLASWLCCVARAPMPDRPRFDLGLDEAAFVPVGGAGVGVGTGFATAAAVRGLPIEANARTVGPAEFVAEMIGALGARSDERLATAAAAHRVSLEGGDLHLFLPVGGGQRAGRTEAGLDAAVVAEVAAAPAMARSAIADFVGLLAADVPLASLAAPEGSAVFAPMVTALDDEGVSTVADLFARGPEPALAVVRPRLAAQPAFAERAAPERAMGEVYAAALGLSTDAAASLGRAATDADRVFVRHDLDDDEVLGKVRAATRHRLRGRGLTQSALREIAARAIDARR